MTTETITPFAAERARKLLRAMDAMLNNGLHLNANCVPDEPDECDCGFEDALAYCAKAVDAVIAEGNRP